MKAVVWHGPRDVRVDSVDDPQLKGPDEAIVRVTHASICGSDLHPYRGIMDFEPGTILGHEFVGVVEEVGQSVQGFRPGDRVVASLLVACGSCGTCRRGHHWQCERANTFGYGPAMGEPLPGGQAEFVRVPFADVSLLAIPEEVTEEAALFVGDILSTGYLGALNGDIHHGRSVAVIGSGPVGVLAQLCSQLFGPAQVLGLDIHDDRLQLAAAAGSTPVNSRENALAQVRELTDERGADTVIECAGDAIDLALDLVASHGTVAIIAHQTEAWTFPYHRSWDELTVRGGGGNPLAHGAMLMELVRRGRIDPTFIISHRMGLDEAPNAYELFDKREATKVVLIS